ncbi:serine hydrolase domain-containing protein [Spirosoma flavum]|uniref:Serine hydrolase domain-containing protein n=1 Tax=Spirosoma flavum TaxID=2048557 RepID=A0ABW6AG23_9BACT
MYTTLSYVYRCIAWNLPNLDDHQRFPKLPVLNNPGLVMPLPVGQPLDLSPVSILYEGKTSRQVLERFLQQSGTASFLILHRNEVVYEKYAGGYTADNIITSLSVSKSLVSALVGIALEEGILPGLDSSILEQLPELSTTISSKLTIRHLLGMSSGLHYYEGVSPWSDDARIYYSLNLRKQLLNCETIESPGKYYHYNNYNLLLLGRLLEKATGMAVPTYFSQKIWSPMGAEQPASWNIDSARSGFAKMESGFNATARDFARFGLLYLNKGRFGNRQIIPEAWVNQSTSQPNFEEFADSTRYMTRRNPPLGQWVDSPVGYYKYLWWGYRNGPHQDPDYFAMGNLGQFIYCSPLHQTVIVRFGKKWGNIDWWPTLFRELSQQIDKPGS